MEVFAADRQILSDVADFPIHLTPFPDAVNMLYDDRTAEIPPPETQHRSQQLPPQKLRPIRCNGRIFPEHSDPPVEETAGFYGRMLGCNDELGFLTRSSPECLADGGCVVGGSSCPVVDFPTIERMKTEMSSECQNLITEAEGRLFEAELSFSSSSDEDGASSEAMTEPSSRKRKRKTRKKLELLLENLMRKVIQKQEQMHKQLIEMVEKMERERIIREVAWQKQEIERVKKDEETRTEEKSRSLALISFIKDFLGHEIQIPKFGEASYFEKDTGEITKDLGCDSCNKRWPKSEVQALITVRTALDHKFCKGPKSASWEEVAVGLSNVGYSRNARKCKEKWENINKYYRRTTENGKKHPDNGKTCPYFHELDILYKNGLINPGNASHSIKNENEGQECG
ncbi:Trihelix transcription factor GT-2 like [Actinidia chinensis var. chinensis]|uniref:Trihelix transcription factor GT-2 like n=1 Tax=Actinidia chinensis var. chinensis TaxID=1590841 RepID=A0A2R6PXB6_ACTCC|nr:Trihelix transcription factor GT-2 like [Actinidia chinensis var. chinensis]